MLSYHNFHDFYLGTLASVNREYSFISQPRGALEREQIGFGAVIRSPYDRYCYAPKRKQNSVFNYAEALWYLSGKNDLEFISYFAPRMTQYSADGQTLPGTGYGPKLLSFGADGLNQISRAIEILQKDDPDSKRIFLQIFDAHEELRTSNIDVSCTLGLQLFLREGRLHMVAYMRANDAYIGMLSDVFSFTFIQEFIASALGCGLGTYTHIVGSIHVYENNFDSVDQLLDSKLDAIDPPADLPLMPKGASFSDVKETLACERLIRKGKMTFDDIMGLSLNMYWKEILLQFLIYSYIRNNNDVPPQIVNQLSPIHRTLVTEKWPGIVESIRELT
jgi:thymidylate synthase